MIITLVKERYARASKNMQQAMNLTFMLFGNKSLKHSTVSQIRKKADLFLGIALTYQFLRQGLRVKLKLLKFQSRVNLNRCLKVSILRKKM